MSLAIHTFKRKKPLKSEKQILKEHRTNKLRKLEGKPLINYGSDYEYESIFSNMSMSMLLE